MEFSNRQSFAGSGMIAAVCLMAGSATGHLGVAIGAVMFAVFGLWYLFLGDSVEIDFADSDELLGFWDRLQIRRMVNRCYGRLRRLRLSPPTISPIIGVASLPIALTPGSSLALTPFGTACICSASAAPDTSGFVYRRPYHKVSIASAYLNCYFTRLFNKNGTVPPSEHMSAARLLMEEYFYNALADTPFIPPRETHRWPVTLISIRNMCGKKWFDPVMAHTLQLLISAIKKEDESFDVWFYHSLQAAMMNRTSPDRTKIEQAVSLLIEHGLLKEEEIRPYRMGI
jgi:hypothetical protein